MAGSQPEPWCDHWEAVTPQAQLEAPGDAWGEAWRLPGFGGFWDRDLEHPHGGCLMVSGEPQVQSPPSPTFKCLRPSLDCQEGLALQIYCRAQEFLSTPDQGVWGTAARVAREAGVILISR